ncbi:MAG: cupin domain-containing protein [Duncaniella sp.]|nr:cupin domain-containing protein [Duncaniella sp.]
MLSTELKFGEVRKLADQVSANAEKVNVKSLFETSNGGVALLAFKAGQALSEHMATAEVMVNVLEGRIDFTMLGTSHTINAGEFLLMGAEVLHSVRAIEDSKVMLLKVKP